MEGSIDRVVKFGRPFVISKGADVRHQGMKRLPEDRSTRGGDGASERHGLLTLRGKRIRFDPNAPYSTLM